MAGLGYRSGEGRLVQFGGLSEDLTLSLALRSISVSGLLTAPCGDFDKSADLDRFGEIGSHIWSTIYLTVRGRVAV
jgi:hypothetical protein